MNVAAGLATVTFSVLMQFTSLRYERQMTIEVDTLGHLYVPATVLHYPEKPILIATEQKVTT